MISSCSDPNQVAIDVSPFPPIVFMKADELHGQLLGLVKPALGSPRRFEGIVAKWRRGAYEATTLSTSVKIIHTQVASKRNAVKEYGGLYLRTRGGLVERRVEA